MFNRNKIGQIVRDALSNYTSKPRKAMHRDIRVYDRDAIGEYPDNVLVINTLGISVEGMQKALIEIEKRLDINLGSNEDYFLDPKIAYHKSTRLHQVVDFVYSEYVDQENAKTTNIETELEPEPELLSADEVLGEFYIIEIKHTDTKYYINLNLSDGSVWHTSNRPTAFSKNFIDFIFDITSKDVIETANEHTVTTSLKEIKEPFEINFIKIAAVAVESWIYDEQDKLDKIMSKLTTDEVDFIKSRLKN